MSVFSNNLLLGAAGQSTGPAPFDPTLIGNSVWLDGSADGLTAPSSTFSAEDGKEFTLGTWFQLNQIGVSEGLFCAGATPYTSLRHDDDNKIYFQTEAGTAILKTQALFRDVGWYHVLVSVDTTQSVASNRVRLFVNGTEQTLDGTQPSVNHVYEFNTDVVHEVGDSFENGAFKGYLAQSFMIGSKSIQQGDFAITDFLGTFIFGTNGSQFIPKKNTEIKTLVDAGSSNSFLLQYEDSSALGTDSSTNTNTFTATSMSSANQSSNTPSLVFPTFSALNISSLTSLSEGNLKAVGSGSEVSGVWATRPISAGETIYFEGTWGSTSGWGYFGVSSKSYHSEVTSTFNADSSTHIFQLTPTASNRGVASAGSALFTGKTTWTTTDTFQIAIDINNGKLWFGVNDSWYDSGGTTTGDPAAGTNPTVTFTAETPMFVVAQSGAASSINVNFGQDSKNVSSGNADQNGKGDFEFAPPSGFLAFCSANLTAPEFQGIDYFTSTLYEGNGQNQRVGDFVPFTDTFTVSKSAMFDNGDRRYLARTYSGSDTARSGTTSTISYWIKYCSSANSQYVIATSDSGQTKRFIITIDSSGASSLILDPPGSGNSRLFTVPASFLSEQEWTNFVWQVDPDNATAADKVKAWVNGVQITSTDTSYQSTSASEYYLFDNEEHFVGNLPPASAGYTAFCLNSYLAELNVLDGQLKAPTDFGEVDTSTNRWIPKDYDTNVGAYGNRGFYMEFLNPTGTGNGVGTDSSGNGFNFTESNVSGGSAWATTDQFIDTPSANYAILDSGRAGASVVLAQGNLKQTAGTDQNVQATMAIPKSGKWAFTANIDVLDFSFGIVSEQNSLTTKIGRTSTSWGIIESTGASLFQVEHNSVGSFNLGSQPSVNDKLIAAIDMDTNSLWLGYDTGSGFTYFGGGNPATGATPTYQGVLVTGQRLYFAIGNRLSVSFGGQSATLYGTLPTGFLELNQDNLDDTASKITALAWIKNRDAADDNIWMDRVIGTSGYLSTTQNDSGTAATSFGDGGSDVLTTNANVVQRFLQRGVQVGNDENVNTANESYVLWQWLLGDSATTGSSITTGSPSLATTGVVSDANHFSIVQYTGNGTDNATFAHGLGATPNFVMVKRISGSAANSDWVIHIPGLGTENYIYPHYRIALSSGASSNGMSPDANLVEIGTGVAINTSGATHMAYSFKNTPGLCKIGTYVGNSSTDGTYVSTGFRPSWLWIFNTTLTSADAERPIIDTARYKFNGTTTAGGINGGINFSDQRAAEEAQTTSLGVNPAIDILSDGFKLRANDSTINTGTTYMYICMADIAGNGTLPPVYGR